MTTMMARRKTALIRPFQLEIGPHDHGARAPWWTRHHGTNVTSGMDQWIAQTIPNCRLLNAIITTVINSRIRGDDYQDNEIDLGRMA